MPSIINYSDLKKRHGFDDLATFIITDKTKIKYPDRTATLKLNDKLNKNYKKLRNKETKQLKDKETKELKYKETKNKNK